MLLFSITHCVQYTCDMLIRESVKYQMLNMLGRLIFYGFKIKRAYSCTWVIFFIIDQNVFELTEKN